MAGRRILIVEDHGDLREAMCALLESWGHSVREAANGRQALALALSWRPDIVCLDLGLPVMSGYDVATRIAAALGDRRPLLIAVTGLSRAIDRRRAGEAGFDAFISKPGDIDSLRDLVAGGAPLAAKAALPSPAKRAAR